MPAITITPIYAGLLALAYLLLTLQVIRLRWRFRVGLGDGGQALLQRAIRVHGNFAEYAAFGLVLLLLTELGGAPIWAVHTLGGLLLAGRLAHLVGLYGTDGPSVGRTVGMVLTLAMLTTGGGLCLMLSLT
jgi:uncharacterized protein